MNRDDLERALADQFDAEHLSVYGDYLQSIGDPRGDLIAFDLSELDDARRRDQLIAEWLGGDPNAILPGGPFPGIARADGGTTLTKAA